MLGAVMFGHQQLPAGHPGDHRACRILRQGAVGPAEQAVQLRRTRGASARRDRRRDHRGLWRAAEAGAPDPARGGQGQDRRGLPGRGRAGGRRKDVQDAREGDRARRHHQDRPPHRRPRHQDGAPDRERGRHPAARPRLGAVHPRRDAGAGRDDARHRPGRADHRRARGRVPLEFHAALQLPALLDRRGGAHGLARTARDRPRQARLARGAPAAAGQGQLPLHDPRRLGDHRIERLLLDGDASAAPRSR